ELRVDVPTQPLSHVASHEMWAEVYDRIAALSRDHRTTLVFVNTRRLAERVAHQLTQRLGEGKVAPHHGSLSRQIRLDAERRLKSGELAVVVATASLELGIDIGHVDLVCHLGAPRALATLLQRVGRSGHWLGSVPKGVLFPLTRDELVQCAAAVQAARAGELDRIVMPRKPLDVLAQQMVAIAASDEIREDDLWALIRRTLPYHHLRRVEAGKVRVENAHGAPPSVPFWLGEAPARTAELSQAVSALRQAVADRLGDRESVTQWLIAETGVDRAGAEQIVAYVAETVAILGCVPTAQTIVAERFFDEAGGMQLILHTPFGGRINRAWGLAIRKRFCLTF